MVIFIEKMDPLLFLQTWINIFMKYKQITYYNTNGDLHREDGPAVVFANGYKAWWLNGERHREDGPATIYADGTQEWGINGELHREDGPAYISADGTQEWWINGELHREDGPAIIYPDGTQEWWVNNECYGNGDNPPQKYLDELKRVGIKFVRGKD